VAIFVVYVSDNSGIVEPCFAIVVIKGNDPEEGGFLRPCFGSWNTFLHAFNN